MDKGAGSCLAFLDIRNNPIRSHTDLAVLAGFPKLQQLMLYANGGTDNKNLDIYRDYHTTLAHALPQIKFLDGQSAEIITEDKSPSPCKTGINELYPFNPSASQHCKKVCFEPTLFGGEHPHSLIETPWTERESKFPRTETLLQEFRNRKQPLQIVTNSMSRDANAGVLLLKHSREDAQNQTKNLVPIADQFCNELKKVCHEPKVEKSVGASVDTSHTLVQTNCSCKYIDELEMNQHKFEIQVQALKGVYQHS